MGYPMSVYSDDDGAFANKNNVQKLFESEGVRRIVMKTHANAAERSTRTRKNTTHDRARFNKFTDALTPALKQYNSTLHSPTKTTPTEAHKHDNKVNVKVKLKLKEKNTRKYPSIEKNDQAKCFKREGAITPTENSMSVVGAITYSMLIKLNMILWVTIPTE